MGNGKIRPSTEYTPLNHHQKLSQLIVLATPTTMPNLVQIRPQVPLGKWIKYNHFFKFMPFSGMHLYVIPVDGVSQLTAQTMWTGGRVCLLGVSLILFPI